MTDAGLKELAGLKNLSTLDLCHKCDGCRDEGTGGPQEPHHPLPRCARFVPSHHRAKGREPSLTDAGAKGLAALESLTALDLDGNNVTDAILKELAALKNLTALNLSGN